MSEGLAIQTCPTPIGPYQLFTDPDVTQWLIDNYLMEAAPTIPGAPMDVHLDDIDTHLDDEDTHLDWE